jgi:cobalamin biosynthesis protein CobD/CbiB
MYVALKSNAKTTSNIDISIRKYTGLLVLFLLVSELARYLHRPRLPIDFLRKLDHLTVVIQTATQYAIRIPRRYHTGTSVSGQVANRSCEEKRDNLQKVVGRPAMIPQNGSVRKAQFESLT